MKVELKDNVLQLGDMRIALQHRAMLSLLCWALFPDPDLHRSHRDTLMH